MKIDLKEGIVEESFEGQKMIREIDSELQKLQNKLIMLQRLQLPDVDRNVKNDISIQQFKSEILLRMDSICKEMEQVYKTTKKLFKTEG